MCVVYSGIITIGMLPFRFSTFLQAIGSKNMLNSAAGVLFPFVIAPPMMTICFIFSLIWG